ncbi:hypothetical protein NM208_g11575 [Fusarium decemcellulare]|uniref:Uncharacterized protein n=1 Tax=Fusarium decemcellulare TaxID=57161 RepID=A0ACC1RUK6_9HYPO|nr:hypothetical protein NM208_g11575 [Fusarium decemcellulare]
MPPILVLAPPVHGSERDPNLRSIVKGLRAGMLPFGGVGGSGYGRFAGEEGLRGLCNIKAVCEDRFGWLGIRTGIPPPVQYPVASQPDSWKFTQGVVELGYGSTARKAKGLAKILKNM